MLALRAGALPVAPALVGRAWTCSGRWCADVRADNFDNFDNFDDTDDTDDTDGSRAGGDPGGDA